MSNTDNLHYKCAWALKPHLDTSVWTKLKLEELIELKKINKAYRKYERKYDNHQTLICDAKGRPCIIEDEDDDNIYCYLLYSDGKIPLGDIIEKDKISFTDGVRYCYPKEFILNEETKRKRGFSALETFAIRLKLNGPLENR